MTAFKPFLFVTVMVALSQTALGVWIPCPQDGEFLWGQKIKSIPMWVGTVTGYKDLSPPAPKYPWQPITEFLPQRKSREKIEQTKPTKVKDGLVCQYTTPNINPKFSPSTFLSYSEIEYKNCDDPFYDSEKARWGFNCN